MVKKGDTLIEVTLAIGIFSMVAISIAAVLSSSTSGAQTALETTLTREEIDTQADALRYIQTAYAVNKNNTEKNKYQKLWAEITKNAIDFTDGTWTDEAKAAITQYSPTSCSNLYSDTKIAQHAFIINPRALGELNPSSTVSVDNAVNHVFNLHTNGKLTSAITYPRLVFGASKTNNNTTDTLTAADTSTNLIAAEGLYVLAVKDANTTQSVTLEGVENSSSFYDFYIRSCWYGTDADQPSTISTVIRLYNPDAVASVANGNVDATFDVHTTGYTVAKGTLPTGSIFSKKITLPILQKYGYTFKGWYCTNIDTGQTCESDNGGIYPGGKTLTNPSDTTLHYKLEDKWDHTKYTINYHINPPYTPYGTSIAQGTCYLDQPCTINNTQLTASGYQFNGWCTVNVETNGTCTGQKFNPGTTWPAGSESSPSKLEQLASSNAHTLNLYAIWQERNETLTVKLTFPSGDCDSHVTGKKSDGSDFHAYYGNKIDSDTSGLTIAQLDHDYTSGGTETVTINTLGGRTYYYYVNNYSGCSLSSASVTVSGPYSGTKTFNYNSSHVSGKDWHAFVYKDGTITAGW